MKIKLHIFNDDHMDKDVYIEKEFPCLPPKGSIIWLSHDEDKRLLELATGKEWLYCDNVHNGIMHFEDCIFVKEILFDQDNNIHIELSK